MSLLVPKSRKPRFELTLRIIDLNNVPLIVGTSYVKWHLPTSTSAEHRGRTDKARIRDHKAAYDYSKQLPVRLTVDRKGVLEECEVHFEVLQDYGGNDRRGGRVVLGNVRVNLCEYVGRDEEEGLEAGGEREGEEGRWGGITRRYLMQDSRINSTLKIGIRMRQVEGETGFTVPPLKTATVFGGIAGIIATDPADGRGRTDSAVGSADDNSIPSISSKTRELAEAQDIYRRTLAATWACQTGELPPDKLIEDIFAGGDGGAMKPPAHPARARAPRLEGREGEDSGGTSDAEGRRVGRSTTSAAGGGLLSPDVAAMRKDGNGGGNGSGHGNRQRRQGTRGENADMNGNATLSASTSMLDSPVVSGRGSIDQHVRQSRKEHRKRDQAEYKEVTEFDIREDLRSWIIRDRGSLDDAGEKHGSINIDTASLELEGI